MERNKSIDFYRFAFCLPVILLHISVSTTLYDERFTLGGNAVEFFFVLSGFLLGRYIKKTSEKDIFVSHQYIYSDIRKYPRMDHY